MQQVHIQLKKYILLCVNSMKKLLILLFSLTLSFSSLADNITKGICMANFYEDKLQIFQKDFLTIDSNELLTVCNEGDILNLGGFEFFDTPEYIESLDTLNLDAREWETQFDYQMERMSNSSSSKFSLSLIMAKYCDLKETHIIGNEILVCKLVDRDLK